MSKDEEFHKRLMETFRQEAAEHLSAISSGLLELETGPPASERQAAIVETVFRESHSMKGAARAVNLSAIEKVCQSFESVMSALKRNEIQASPEMIDLLHRSVSLLERLLSTQPGSAPAAEEVRPLVSELEAAAKGGALGGRRSDEREAKPAAPPAPAAAAGSAEQPAAAETLPPIVKLAGETMRISKQRIDSILLEAEGLLTARQQIGQLAHDLHDLAGAVATLKKEWIKIRPDVRTVRDHATANRNGGATPATHARLNKLLDFLDAKGETITRLHHAMSAVGTVAEQDSRALAAMSDNLMEELKSLSMLPFSSLTEMLPKVVRDLAHDRGKEAMLTLSGGDVQIDRRVLDELREPVIHLVRNCVDHGIEKPGERAAWNKPRAGTISVSASNTEGKQVEIVVADDGAGVSLAKISTAAVTMGLLTPEQAETPDEHTLLTLLFRSGFSTSPLITEVSGRGLGLAIVQERVEKVGGSISCETSEGRGTAFRIRIPQTLATFRGVLVEVAGHQFMIPLAGIERSMRVRTDSIRTVENREMILVDGRVTALVPLAGVLELPSAGERSQPENAHVEVVVLEGGAGQAIAFAVDAVFHEQEVLMKDLGKQLSRVRNVAGATVLGSGRVVPVLNVADLLKSAVRLSPGQQAPVFTQASQPAARKSVLVVEDSITSRMLLKNILEASGYQVQTAVDGVDALTALRTGRFDIVVSDIDMPRMNGLDLTARIRADRQLQELPVVLVTALESREDRERGIDVGANAYIVKSSFDQSNLLEIMRRLV